MKERWWENFDGFTQKLLDHVDQIADVCKLTMELEPDLALLCVDFMSADFAGHLGWHRLDPNHPAHRPDEAGDELVRVYQAVDAACGELAEEAERRYGEEPTVLVLSDHGMKPIYWTFHLNRWLEEAGLLRYRRRSLQRLRRTRLDYLAKVDQRLVRTRKPYGRAFDRLPLPRAPEDRLFADIDFGSTRAYAFGYGGQLFLGEASGALGDAGFERELVAGLEAVAPPRDRRARLRGAPKGRPLPRARSCTRRPTSSCFPGTSGSTSTPRGGPGTVRSTATTTSTRPTLTATRATTACGASSPPRARGSPRPRSPATPRSRSSRRRSSPCSASTRTWTERRSRRSSTARARVRR